MPRGRKAVINYNEEIEKIDEQIAKYRGTVAQLQSRRRELMEAKEKKELGELYQAVRDSGKSIQEILATLQADSEPAV